MSESDRELTALLIVGLEANTAASNNFIACMKQMNKVIEEHTRALEANTDEMRRRGSQGDEWKDEGDDDA